MLTPLSHRNFTTNWWYSELMFKFVREFLTFCNKPQTVTINRYFSKPITLNTGTPQRCMLSPPLFSFFTNDCTPIHSSVIMINSLIQSSDETAYHAKIERLASWCRKNNLEPNVSKTKKEIVFDFHGKKTPTEPLMSNADNIEIIDNFKFLGTTITSDIKWDKNMKSILKKTHSCTTHRAVWSRRTKDLTRSYKQLLRPSAANFHLIPRFTACAELAKPEYSSWRYPLSQPVLSAFAHWRMLHGPEVKKTSRFTPSFYPQAAIAIDV